MQGFQAISNSGGSDIEREFFIVGNSERVYTGLVVKTGSAGGVDEYDSAGETTLIGVVDGIYGYNGNDLLPYSVITTTDYGHTSNTNSPAEQDATASATNESRANKIVVSVVLVNGVKFSGYLDDAAATTTGSNVPGYYLACVTTAGSAQNLDESTASGTITNTVVVLVAGKSPADATDPIANDSRRVYCRFLRQACLLG